MSAPDPAGLGKLLLQASVNLALYPVQLESDDFTLLGPDSQALPGPPRNMPFSEPLVTAP